LYKKKVKLSICTNSAKNRIPPSKILNGYVPEVGHDVEGELWMMDWYSVELRNQKHFTHA
jgi:hypothetical protein